MTMQTPAPSAKIPSRRMRSFGSIRATSALILREMATTYGRSPGGYIWAILEPIAGIALLSLVFSAAFRGPALGTNFPIFYATGMLPFVMFTDVHGKVALSLMFSKQLLTYPTVTYIDALVARFILNTMTQLMIGYIILVGIMLAFETRVNPDLVVIVQAYALAALLALGIGTLNCYLFSRFPVMQRAWSILMRPMFLISCIFFLFETLPPTYQNILWYNPLVHIIGLMRRGFYGTYDASYVSVTYIVGLSLGCMALGLLLLRRHHRDILHR